MVVMKNCEPFVLGPEFYIPLARLIWAGWGWDIRRGVFWGGDEGLTAIERSPGVSCRSVKFSSAKDLVP
jgi:hypothetical protein